MAKLLRHFGLGVKKYNNNNNNTDSSQQDSLKADNKQEPKVKQFDSGLAGERTHSGISERKHCRPNGKDDEHPATDDLCECASNCPIYANISMPANRNFNGTEEKFLKGFTPSPESKNQGLNGRKKGFRRKAVRSKPVVKSSVSPPNHTTQDITKIVLIEEYSDPADFRIPLRNSSSATSFALECPSTSEQPPLIEDDYIEPFEVQNFTRDSLNEESLCDELTDDAKEDVYDNVCETEDALLNVGFLPQSPLPGNDCRPGDEYDVPWEWGRQFGQPHPAYPRCTTSLSSASSSAVSDTSVYLADSLDSVAHQSDGGGSEEAAMTGRQRHIYETAFDSTGKADKEEAEFGTVFHSRSEMPPESNAMTVGSKPTTPKGTPPSVNRTMACRPEPPVPKERRKIALVRDSLRGGCSGPVVCSASPMIKRTLEPLVTRAIVHLPPRSANSTPTLSYRAKEGLDSCASSAKSTPTHYLSKGHHLPLRQFSDLTLGENKNTSLNKSTPVSALGRLDGERRLPSNGTVSSEESVASTSSSSSSNNNSRGSRGSIDNHRELKLAQTLQAENQKTSGTISKFQRHLQNLQQQRQQQQTTDSNGIDSRPSEDYDSPWDIQQKLKSSALISNSSLTNPSTCLTPPNVAPRPSLTELKIVDKCATKDLNSPTDRKQSWASNESSQPSNPPNKPSFQLPLNTDSTTPCRSNLALNLNSQSPKRKRNNLQLNFGCAALSVVGEAVDPTIPLDRQGWYHGTISRIDAENLLRLLQEGCYLVRNSESSKQDYSLSLKSARGFMHMKIVHSDGKYILGQFSKPFTSIPEMIHHYSRNKLPIKGAEHMSLLHPVIDQLL